MAIRCSPHAPHVAPETPCAAVRPSLPPSLGLSAPPRLQTTERKADALAVTKTFPAPRSLPATAASSCPAPRGPRWLPVAPQSHQLMCSPLPRGAKPGGGTIKTILEGQQGKPPRTGLRQSLGCAMGCSGSRRDRHPTSLGLEGARCPHDRSPQPQKQQVPGTHWVPACRDAASRWGGHRGAGRPGNSPGSVLSQPRHPPWLETTTTVLPSGRSRQLPVPAAKGGCSWLQGRHHPSPLTTFPSTPAGSQPCFSSKLEAKNSPGGAEREHGVQTGPCEHSCPPPHPSWGVLGPSPRTPSRNQPQDPAPHRSPLPATAAPGSPRVPGWVTPWLALTEAGGKRQHRARRRFPEFVCKGLNNPR